MKQKVRLLPFAVTCDYDMKPDWWCSRERNHLGPCALRPDAGHSAPVANPDEPTAASEIRFYGHMILALLVWILADVSIGSPFHNGGSGVFAPETAHFIYNMAGIFLLIKGVFSK